MQWTVLNLALPLAAACVLTPLVHNHFYPPSSLAPRTGQLAYGPVTLRIKLPGTYGGILEPLLVYGEPGNASLVFIRLLAGRRAQIGVEFWNRAKFESEPFAVPAADAEITVKSYLPAFFPREGDPYWGSLSPSFQKGRRTSYQVVVDGVVRLKGSVDYDRSPDPELYFGTNPLGGSFVSDRFTGKILTFSQPQ